MFVGGQGAPPDGRSSLAGGPGGGNGHGCGADGDYSIREKMSIKSDDVDSLLGGGGNVSDSRMKINGRVRKVNFFQNPSSFNKNLFSFRSIFDHFFLLGKTLLIIDFLVAINQ